MQKVTPRTWILIVVVLMAIALAILSFRATAAGTVIVSGNSAAGENQPGWLFNHAVTDGAPYAFNFEAKHNIGTGGSLKVGPLSAANQFNAYMYPDNLPSTSFTEFSYDYMLGSDRSGVDSQYVTVSVFANTSTGESCQFDYSPLSGSNTNFVKHLINADIAANPSEERAASCGQTISQLPENSIIRAFAITVGNASADDEGLVVYLDGVELYANGDSTLYNFEPAPRTQADCADKKWQQYQFRNQGQCLKSIDKNAR